VRKAIATERSVAEALTYARTEADVHEIIRIASDVYGSIAWRDVGDRPNNHGTIRLGSDPALGVVERLINAQDSMLDLGRQLNPNDNVRSPIEAAQKWFGVPKNGISEMTATQRRELGEKVRVWLDESGDIKRPTIVWEDDGIGQSASEFPRTFMSLNEDNKAKQRWNMGTYGQGGAVTLGFSRATVIYSRRHPDFRGSAPDQVGWTIAMEIETDPEKELLSKWQYLVGADNKVLSLSPDLFAHLEHGSRVTCIAYDLQGWTGPYTTGLWQFLHAAIFEPVLPFLITGRRKKDKQEQYRSRIVIGNTARLDNPERARGDIEVTHKETTHLDLGSKGNVVFRYWVISRPKGSDTKSEPAKGYVRPDSAIALTLFGQRQDTRPRSWIKDHAKLPFIHKNMVVQIKADGLKGEGKRELFASTRERATKSDLQDRIYNYLAKVLHDDEELRRLNFEERERLLRHSTAASSKKVRKRLAQFIKTRMRNLQKPGQGSTDHGRGGARRDRSGGERSARDHDDSQLSKVPTAIRIQRRSMPLNQGGSCWTWVEIDAKNGYLPAHNDSLTVEIGGGDGKVRLVMRSELLGGLSKWTFEADPDAPMCEVAVRVGLMTPNGLLEDSTVLQVTKPPDAAPRKLGTEPETGPEVQWVRKEHWHEHEMTRTSVGRVEDDGEVTIIWVNRHFHLLDRALARRTLTEEQVTTRADRYQFPIAVALWLQHAAIKDADPAPSTSYLTGEMERLAEAVLLAADPDVDVALEQGDE